MAALLRQGVRKIGGSMFQRTQAAAVAEERRRLVTRRLYSTEEGAPHQKKEEFYDALAGAKKSPTPGGFDWRRSFARFREGAATFSEGVATCGNFAVKMGLLIVLASECPPFRKRA